MKYFDFWFFRYVEFWEKNKLISQIQKMSIRFRNTFKSQTFLPPFGDFRVWAHDFQIKKYIINQLLSGYLNNFKFLSSFSRYKFIPKAYDTRRPARIYKIVLKSFHCLEDWLVKGINLKYSIIQIKVDGNCWTWTSPIFNNAGISKEIV